MTIQAPPPMWPPGPGMPSQPPAPQRRYSRFSALFLSFFSAALYRDVARAWRGIGLLYLLLLCLLTWVPVLIKAHVGVRRASNDPSVTAVINQFPSVTISKGVVSIKEPEPYVVKDPKSGKVLLYVDTSNRFDRPDAAQAEFLLGRSTLQVRQGTRMQVHDLSNVQYLYVDKTVANNWLNVFSKAFVFVALPAAMLVSLVWGLVRLLLYALLGMIFNSMFNARLDYAALMRLSAVAMTPAMALDTAGWLLGLPPMPCCGWSFIAGAITLGYLAFATKANAQPVVPPGFGPTYGFPLGTTPPGYPPQPGYPQAPAPWPPGSATPAAPQAPYYPPQPPPLR